jgi:hypothetical protein
MTHVAMTPPSTALSRSRRGTSSSRARRGPFGRAIAAGRDRPEEGECALSPFLVRGRCCARVGRSRRPVHLFTYGNLDLPRGHARWSPARRFESCAGVLRGYRRRCSAAESTPAFDPPWPTRRRAASISGSMRPPSPASTPSRATSTSGVRSPSDVEAGTLLAEAFVVRAAESAPHDG